MNVSFSLQSIFFSFTPFKYIFKLDLQMKFENETIFKIKMKLETGQTFCFQRYFAFTISIKRIWLLNMF